MRHVYKAAVAAVLIVAGAFVPITAIGQVCTPPPSGLVSWFPGDGNADDIADGNNGTLQGGIFFSPAKVSQGFTFDSNDDRVAIAHNANLNVNNPGFTADFWLRGVKNQPEPLFDAVDKSHGFIDNSGWTFQGVGASGSIFFLIGADGGPPFSNFPGVG